MKHAAKRGIRNPSLRPFSSLAALVVAFSLPFTSLAQAETVAQAAAEAPAQRQMAVTFDDLPGVVTQRGLEPLREITDKLLASLRQQGLEAIGFVNEGKLRDGGDVDPRRVDLLRRWLAAGHELGNHTFSHPDLHRIPLAQFKNNVLRGERLTKELSREAGSPWRFFRHPFLHTGRDLETKRAFEAFLAEHGYRVAPVSIDNSEWIYARAYDLALDRKDRELSGRIGESYVAYMDDVVAYYEQQSRAFLGYELKQILLLHANRLNGDYLNALLGTIRDRGYAWVSLEEALEDPAYGRPDTYVGPGGITWLHRWALTAGKKGDFFAGEPEVPAWVREVAGF